MTARNAPIDVARGDPDPAETGVWAVVPVKVLGEAKRRLHRCLADRREAFTLAMLEDVLRALDDSRRVDRVGCVTADPRVAAAAARHAALVIDEGRPRGMNQAIGLGVETVRARGARQVVVLPADLPLATGKEIDRLISALEDLASPGQAVVGLSPAADGRGTNFLSLDGDQRFETRFGPDSFRDHQAGARAEGFRTVLLDSETLSFDIDCEQDLQDLVSYCSRHPEFQRTSSWKYLCRHGLAETLTP